MDEFDKAHRAWKKAHAPIFHIDALLKSAAITPSIKAILNMERARLMPGVEALRLKACALSQKS